MKEAQSLKMKVLKRQRFFIIGRLGELSFILKEAESLKMKVLKRRHLSSKGRLGECRPQEPTCDLHAVRLDENDARQMLSAYRVCHAKFR